ncbi:MAG: hypothetical protein R3E79_62525 [Caldilineaceae bacterium]
MKKVRIALLTLISAVLLALLLETAGANFPRFIRAIGDGVERTITQHLIEVWVEQQ